MLSLFLYEIFLKKAFSLKYPFKMIADTSSNNNLTSAPRRGSNRNAKCFTDAGLLICITLLVAGCKNYSPCFTDAETETLRNKSMKHKSPSSS